MSPLVHGIHAADSGASGELVQVPMQVLTCHPVIDAVVAALEQGPEPLDAVGVDRAAHVLARSAVHRVVSVLPQLPIGTGPVRVHRGTRLDRILHESSQSLGIRCRNRLRCHIAATLLGTHNRRLADGSATGLEFLRFVLVPLLASAVNLVDLDDAAERRLAVPEHLADSLEHVPCGLLRDAQLAMQLHAGDPLDVGRRHVERNSPCLIAELAGLHDRSLADAEPLAAVLAGVRHGRMGRAMSVVAGTAVRAGRPVLPAQFLKPPFRRRVVRELVKQLDDRDSLAVRPPRPLRRMVAVSPHEHYNTTNCKWSQALMH